ncbi:probable cytosolic iron-sulfur protein assembly protein CIAO1 homolog [Porites lutea]|uniref:probable cytosolic iron-sulfur protein assembly protein CIAO1 homolog n=1 Tax=Porites lutea TaxID=51062 RepID=UPI003CC54E40
MLSSMSLLPSFLAICPITFTTNDGIFLPVFTLNEGVPTHGSDPRWKTVCVLSGYHDRTVYDVHWSFVTDAIATSSGDDCIRIFQQDPSVGDKNQPTFHQVAVQRKAHSQDVNGVKWHPKESGLLASCSDDGTINMWRFIPQD